MEQIGHLFFWGLINALYFLPLLLSNKNRKYLNIVAYDKKIPSLKEFFQITSTFILTMAAWIFFRAESLEQAFSYIGRIFTDFNSNLIVDLGFSSISKLSTILFIILMIIMEWTQRHNQFGLQVVPKNAILRFSIYMLLFIAVFIFGGNQQTFIYFQF